MKEIDNLILEQIRQIISEGRKSLVKKVNSTIIHSYWYIGQKIVEEEQKGESTAN